MDLENWQPHELANGYRYDAQSNAYRCALCQETFHDGEVYPTGGHFYLPEAAVRAHVRTAHSDLLGEYLQAGTRYIGLTEHQQALFRLLRDGLSDKEIAQRLDITAATVRRQRFTFREKAKQARLYLALYALTAKKEADPKDQLIDLHEGATTMNETMIITAAEEESILKNMFYSLSPLKLKQISPKEKKRLVCVRRIAQVFEAGKEYTEKEVNALLEAVYEDFVTLRRELVDFGYLQRTRDGRAYWVP